MNNERKVLKKVKITFSSIEKHDRCLEIIKKFCLENNVEVSHMGLFKYTCFTSTYHDYTYALCGLNEDVEYVKKYIEDLFN